MELNKKPPFWFIIHKAFPKANLKEQIFAFYPHIYSSIALSEDLLEHENTHLRQQKSFMGACLWWFRYIVSPKYRIKVEIEACRNQIKKAKTMVSGHAVFQLYLKMCRNLSSEVYGNCISYSEVQRLLVYD